MNYKSIYKLFGVFVMLLSTQIYAQVTQKGVSSSQSPYVVPVIPNVTITSLLSVGDVVGGVYTMAGIPDGLGAFDNGDGTFTLLMNQEILKGSGGIRAHGSNGAFVSKWILNKSTLAVQSGSDLMQNIYLWTGTGYALYNAANPSTLAGFGRFCSADLPAVSAYYNSVTGMGTTARIFMNGEETDSESKALAHVVTGSSAGNTYELNLFGKGAWENALAHPATGDLTLVAYNNDGSTTNSKTYFYIGTKTNTGNEIDKAGLTNGKAYAVSVSGFAQERNSSSSINLPPAIGTRFSLVDVSAYTSLTGAAWDGWVNSLGGTRFARCEDGAWNPSNLREYYFNTTDQLDQVNDGIGSQVGRSRVWRLRFDNITNPGLGGTVEAVLDGTEGYTMLDNMTIDKNGNMFLCEDVGNAAHNGKVWKYTIATDKLEMVAKHDIARFGDIGVSATAPFNQDEETSGILDVEDILGKGKYLFVDQAHYAISGPLVEGGQLLLMNIAPTVTPNILANVGPSTTQTPYVQPISSNTTITSLLSVGDVVGGVYTMAGIPDGLGAFDNGDGTFTLLMNHELGNTVGGTRAHGSIGSFVSKWILNKSTLAVQSGSDLIQNVYLWTGTGYALYNAANPSSSAAFGRFCSADLPAVSAFYNSVTGMGTTARIFMNGEETSSESRALAHVVTGSSAGNSYELNTFGKGAWENALANPATGDMTLVAYTNDGTTTNSKTYFYVGTKTNTGSEIEKAGLTNGKAYAVSVSGFAQERNSGSSTNLPPAAGTRFSLVDVSAYTSLTGAAWDGWVNTLGGTKFARCEDGAWNPSNLKEFYFNTTDQLDQVNDGIGSQVGRSRVWRLRFDNITNPGLGGTVEAVLDGTEGHTMLDNMTIDKNGNMFLCEDVGNAAHNGKLWKYTIATDKLEMIAKHDIARFGDIGVAATAPFNQDEETSGILDVEDILGKGKYLFVDQAHYAISGPLAEGGQLLLLTYNDGPLPVVVNQYPNITFNGFTMTVGGANVDLNSVLSTNSAGAKSFQITLGTAASISGSSLVSVNVGNVTVLGTVGTATGYNSISASITVNVVIATDVVDGIEVKSLVLYPNPVNNGKVYFDTEISGNIYNINGILVKSIKDASEINVSGLTKGLYLLRTTDKQTKTFIIE